MAYGKFYPLDLAHWPQINPQVAQAAVKCIKDTLTLLEQPNVWIKGEYESINTEVSNEEETITIIPWRGCLIGAIQKIDGLGELLAASILTSVITGDIYLDRDLVPNKTQQSILKYDNNYVFYIFDGANDPERVEAFNDNESTTFADIRKFLEFSIMEAERVVAHAAAGLGFAVEAA